MPWGTPESTDAGSDDDLSNTSCIFLSVKKQVSQVCSGPSVPHCRSLCRRFSWSTVSKAFEKSQTATFTCLLLSKDARKSFTVVISCVSQEFSERKPWFKSVRMLCVSK